MVPVGWGGFMKTFWDMELSFLNSLFSSHEKIKKGSYDRNQQDNQKPDQFIVSGEFASKNRNKRANTDNKPEQHQQDSKLIN